MDKRKVIRNVRLVRRGSFVRRCEKIGCQNLARYILYYEAHVAGRVIGSAVRFQMQICSDHAGAYHDGTGYYNSVNVDNSASTS